MHLCGIKREAKTRKNKTSLHHTVGVVSCVKADRVVKSWTDTEAEGDGEGAGEVCVVGVVVVSSVSITSLASSSASSVSLRPLDVCNWVFYSILQNVCLF